MNRARVRMSSPKTSWTTVSTTASFGFVMNAPVIAPHQCIPRQARRNDRVSQAPRPRHTVVFIHGEMIRGPRHRRRYRRESRTGPGSIEYPGQLGKAVALEGGWACPEPGRRIPSDLPPIDGEVIRLQNGAD